MRILVFGDVHGSYNSLKELVNTKDFKSADKVIFLGDIVMGASRVNECIELINDTCCECIVGNNDVYAFDCIPNCELEEFSKQKMIQLDYMKKILTDNNRTIMSKWKRELYLSVNNKKLYFVHYPWEVIDNEYSVIDSKENVDLKFRQEMFKDIDAEYIFFAHEHRSSFFEDENKKYYGINTLGLEHPSKYLIVDVEFDQVKVEEKELIFDCNEEKVLIDKAGYPYDKSKIGY